MELWFLAKRSNQQTVDCCRGQLETRDSIISSGVQNTLTQLLHEGFRRGHRLGPKSSQNLDISCRETRITNIWSVFLCVQYYRLPAECMRLKSEG